MKSLSSVGLALSIIFACLFLVLVAELYYILWWKKRKFLTRKKENDYNFSMFCWRRRSSALNPQENSSMRTTNTQFHNPNALHHLASSNSDFLLKPFGEDGKETENSCDNPRLLFTIIEETKEDLESEEGKSRADNNCTEKGSRSRSLSDFLSIVETPYLTPLTSPVYFTPPLTPGNGFNPLNESTTNAEFNGIRLSPPPKFKFLQEAEKKMKKKLMEEAEKGLQKKDASGIDKESRVISMSKFLKDDDEEEGSFITIIVDRNKEKELTYHQSHSCTSQVLPVASSPSTMITN